MLVFEGILVIEFKSAGNEVSTNLLLLFLSFSAFGKYSLFSLAISSLQSI